MRSAFALYEPVGSGRLYGSALWFEFADFVMALGQGKSASPTFREGMATERVTDAVLKSAKTRQWETVPVA